MQNRNFSRIVWIVVLILLVPLIGNFFVEGWNWGVGDFVFAGLLLFCTGIALDSIVRKVTNPLLKIAGCIVVVFVLILLWVELAVDGVSQLLTFLL